MPGGFERGKDKDEKLDVVPDQTNILEPGGTEVSTSAGGARWYRKPLRFFRWREIKGLLGESFGAWSLHNAPRLGAAVANRAPKDPASSETR